VNLNMFSASVSFKLSRRKTDDTFKLLHTILFGRRGKVIHILKTFVFILFIHLALFFPLIELVTRMYLRQYVGYWCCDLSQMFPFTMPILL
jgi:hypothetical protein